MDVTRPWRRKFVVFFNDTYNMVKLNGKGVKGQSLQSYFVFFQNVCSHIHNMVIPETKFPVIYAPFVKKFALIVQWWYR